MSEEYFCIEEIDAAPMEGQKKIPYQEECPGDKREENDHGHAVTECKKSTHRLLEIEEQLQMAENRCNTLKDQLEKMKRVYQTANKGDIPGRFKKASSLPYKAAEESPPVRPELGPADIIVSKVRKVDSSQKHTTSSASCGRPMPSPKKNITEIPVRHTSQAVSTDTTGAAVVTINHILTGITESVNRLSELQTHLGNDGIRKSKPGSRRSSRKGTAFPQKVSQKNGIGKTRSTSVGNQAEISEASLVEAEIPVTDGGILVNCKGCKRRNKQTKSKLNIPKVQESAATVDSVNKRPIQVTAKHTQKKIQINPVRTGMLVEKDSNHASVANKRKKLKRLQSSSKHVMGKKSGTLENPKQFKQYATENLIELYHNVSIKPSDSDDSNGDGKTRKMGNIRARQKTGGDQRIPPLAIHTNNRRFPRTEALKQQSNANNKRRDHIPVKETDYEEPEAPRDDFEFSRSYTHPTIASKLKEVAKTYLESFTFQTIPFCAAKSTTASHNIGINIQQVMSVIKTRQPLEGISPTLAHNIGLVAEKLNSKPLHALVATLSSRMGQVVV